MFGRRRRKRERAEAAAAAAAAEAAAGPVDEIDTAALADLPPWPGPTGPGVAPGPDPSSTAPPDVTPEVRTEVRTEDAAAEPAPLRYFAEGVSRSPGATPAPPPAPVTSLPEPPPAPPAPEPATPAGTTDTVAEEASLFRFTPLDDPMPAEAAPVVLAGAASVVPVASGTRALAERMRSSQQEMAQLSMHMDARMDQAAQLRTELIVEWDADALRPTYTDLVVRAVARALVRHPLLNASIRDDGVELLGDVDVGVTTSTDDDVTVHVVPGAAQRSLKEIVAATWEVASAEPSGEPTFVVTSLGGYGVDSFTPIVLAPNVATLGIGRVRDETRWEGDRPVRAQRHDPRARVGSPSLRGGHRGGVPRRGPRHARAALPPARRLSSPGSRLAGAGAELPRPGGHATVDGERDPRHERGVVGQEEGRGGGHFLGSTPALHRDVRAHLLEPVGRVTLHRGRHPGAGDATRAHRVRRGSLRPRGRWRPSARSSPHHPSTRCTPTSRGRRTCLTPSRSRRSLRPPRTGGRGSRRVRRGRRRAG